MALMVVGIILNGLHIVHDQPQYSLEADPVHKLAAERHANYQFFHLQRARILKRQKRIGQYGWLVLGLFTASSWFLYSDTVKATAASKQISAIKTFAADSSADAVLSLTLGDGSTSQYLVKAIEPLRAKRVSADGQSKEAVRNWERIGLGTALSIGDANLPAGIALKLAN